MIVHAYTSYNILLGRPSLNALGIVVSTSHLTMKFSPDVENIITVHADQRTTKECYMTSHRLHPYTREKALEVIHYVETRMKTEEVEELELNSRTNDDNQVKPVKETSTFQLRPKEEQVTYLGNQLLDDELY